MGAQVESLEAETCANTLKDFPGKNGQQSQKWHAWRDHESPYGQRRPHRLFTKHVSEVCRKIPKIETPTADFISVEILILSQATRAGV